MEKDREYQNCEYCDFKCKSAAGLLNHIHRKHSLEKPSGLECWTCRKQFSQEELLNQHYKTVLHQINCRKVQTEEMSEMPPKTITEIIQEHRECKRKTPQNQRLRLYERPVPSSIQPKRRKLKTPTRYLRKDPAIIPSDTVIPQADLRTEPIMSWLDLTEEVKEDEDEEKSPRSTPKSNESTHKHTASSQFSSIFEKEIAELFDIPKDQIPRSQKSMDLALDLPELILTPETHMEQHFSFLDYLLDKDQI